MDKIFAKAHLMIEEARKLYMQGDLQTCASKMREFYCMIGWGQAIDELEKLAKQENHDLRSAFRD